MSDFVEVKTAELVGQALDWAVASATEAWEFAHEWFPTMTLDPRFIGIRNVAVDGCVWLEPRNPFRQDPQPFRPSTDWALGGPLLEKFNSLIDSHLMDVAAKDHCSCDELIFSEHYRPFYSEISLPKICRAIVAAKLGDVVHVPKELIND